MLAEHMAYLTDRAFAVVGGALHQHRHTAGRVTFITHVFIADTFQLAGASFDRAIDRVPGHVSSQRLVHRSAQRGISGRITAPHAGRYSDFADQLGE